MTFMGPCPLPPAHVQCSLHDSEHSTLSNGHQSDSNTFAKLLCDLFSEHQRCLREAARDGHNACETHAVKTSAYIPSTGSLCREALRMSACDLSAEKQKQIDILQAHIQSAECPQQESWHVTHPKEVGLKPVSVAAPAEPEQDPHFARLAERSSQPVSSSGFEQHQESTFAQQENSLDATVVGQQFSVAHYSSRQASQQSLPPTYSVEKGEPKLGPARGGTVSIISQPQGTFTRGLSSLSWTSELSIQSHCAVEFFEQHKESYDKETGRSGTGSGKIKSSISSTFSGSTFDILPRGLVASSVSGVINSMWFELLIGGLIVANACVMAVEIQSAAKYPTLDNHTDENWPHAQSVFLTLERIFTVIFTFEVIFRVAVLRKNWFKGILNWIDLAFVIVSWLDWIYTEAGILNPMMARMVRLVRVGRGLRLAKLSRALSPLHLLFRSITASVSILSWSVCILLVAQCISGMMLCQLVKPFIADENKDLVARQQVFAYYGTFSRSMITMFEIHLANFGPACRILLDHVGEEYAYVFLAYRCFAGFAIINIINAVFVQQTMKVAEADQDVMLNQKRRAVETYTKKVRAFFNVLDSDGDGSISQAELHAFEDNPTYQLWMSSLDIEASDLRGVFGILDTDQDGAITADELILGASRIKGPARSIDMVHVLAALQRLHAKIDHLSRQSGTLSARSSANTVGKQASQKSQGARQSNSSHHSRVRTL